MSKDLKPPILDLRFSPSPWSTLMGAFRPTAFRVLHGGVITVELRRGPTFLRERIIAKGRCAGMDSARGQASLGLLP